MANVSWNDGLTNSSEKESGSPADVVQVIVMVPPMKTFVGVLRERAEAKGATSTRRLMNLVSILNGRIEKKA